MDAFVLAGGKSSRMGRNKAFVELAGQRLIDRVLAALEPIAARRLIVANDRDAYLGLGDEVIPDRWPDAAALGGIGTALSAATTPRALVVACDLPLLTTDLLRFLVDLDPEAEVTLPETVADGIHPLCAVYSRACLPHIEERIAAGRLKVAGFFPAVRVRLVTEAELVAAGFAAADLANLNTPEELARAEERLSRHR